MDDQQKLELIKKVQFDNFDWMESYRQTVKIPDGHGLPSGITGSEVSGILTIRILQDKRVVIVKRKR